MLKRLDDIGMVEFITNIKVKMVETRKKILFVGARSQLMSDFTKIVIDTRRDKYRAILKTNAFIFSLF